MTILFPLSGVMNIRWLQIYNGCRALIQGKGICAVAATQGSVGCRASIFAQEFTAPTSIVNHPGRYADYRS